ncbi:MAG: hypothetical protein ACJ749_01300 [Flavisolibacter sp.]
MKQFYLLLSTLTLTLTLTFSLSYSQSTQSPCTTPQSSQFDFWIGEWNLTWSDSLHGTNRIEKIFGNCTVHENFYDPKTNYLGQSWSVYNTKYNKWQQTWIDNMGGYIALNGGMHGDSMVLSTEEQNVPASVSPTGKLINRMVYHNIKKDSFDWAWESSTDGGQTWKANWKIRYERKK